MRVEKRRKYSRRNFLKIGAGTTIALGVNEGIRRLTGVGLESPFLPLLFRDNPLKPFHAALLYHYFSSAEHIPDCLNLQEEVVKKVMTKRPESVRELIEFCLNWTDSHKLTDENGARLTLFALAAVSHLKEARNSASMFFPLYLPEGKDPEGKPTRENGYAMGWDKSVHFFSAAYFAFELIRLKNNGGLRNNLKAKEFITSSRQAINLVGAKRIEKIKQHLAQSPEETGRAFPFSPKIHGLRSEEEEIANLLTDVGIAFEVFTISGNEEGCFDKRLQERRALWLLPRWWETWEEREKRVDQFIQRALDHPQSFIPCGIGDIGVSRDCFGNQAGIAFGLGLGRKIKENLPIEIGPIPFDDYSQKFGAWKGEVDHLGRPVGDPPWTYPTKITSYQMGLDEKGDIKFSYTS
jgi:hypothetical protein